MATNHCNCCIPQCPSVNLESRAKEANCVPLNFYRRSTYRDGDGSDDYVVPIPERCQPFKTRRDVSKASISVANTVSTNPDGNNYDLKRTESNGEVGSTWENLDTCSCSAWDGDEYRTTPFGTWSGSTTYQSIVTRPDPDNPGEEIWAMYADYKIEWQMTPKSPYGDVNPTFNTHDLITTITRISRVNDPDTGAWNGGFTTDVETTNTTSSVLQVTTGGGLAYTTTYSNTPTQHTINSELDAGGGSYSSEEEYLTPLTEDILVVKAKECAESKEWGYGSGAEFSVDYKQVPIRDEDGNIVYHDHDGDPQTWEIQKTVESKDCFDKIRLRKSRYRGVVDWSFDPPPEPAEQMWHGTYHKFEAEETFTPEGYDPDNSGSPQPTVTEKELEWRGEGEMPYPSSEFYGDDWNALSEEAQEAKQKEQDRRLDTWKTEWVEIDFPQEKGEIEVKLKRSQCYTGGRWTYH